MGNNYILQKKSNLTKIKINEINYPLPNLKNIDDSKAAAIAKWLMEWIESGLKEGTLQVSNLMPSKPEFAYLLGVSIGTIQNAYRIIEDLGYIESKQCIGTIIRNPRDTNAKQMRKFTSKRDVAIFEIKKYIKDNNFQPGQFIPTARSLAKVIDCSLNTTRIALDYLCINNILEHKHKNQDTETGWQIKTTDFELEKNNKQFSTLIEQVETDLKNYIKDNLSVGDRMPAHDFLSKELKTSIKTIHDGLKILISEGILLARRGRYGTTVIKMPDDKTFDEKKETSIFAPAHETAFYYYEKTQNYLKKMIAENYEAGDKLPSILALSKELDLSQNTIRKAFANLAKEGYIGFARGRYGGTYVIEVPEIETENFRWLAVNPQYTKAYK